MKDEGLSLEKRNKLKKVVYDDRNSCEQKIKESNLISVDEITGDNFKLKSYIQEHFKKLHETDLYLGKWTNNNNESINNVIKQEIDWKPQKHTELIVKLRVMVSRKLLDLKSALHSCGDWSLAIDYRRYAINNSLWNAKGSDWQSKEFLKFLKDSKNVKSSENAISKKYKGLGIAKKPYQSKRPINERTK